MLTIKVRNIKNGSENVFEIQGFEFFEKPIRHTDDSIDIKEGLLVRYEDGGRTHYGVDDNNTQAWIMNRYGATVASYRF